MNWFKKQGDRFKVVGDRDTTTQPLSPITNHLSPKSPLRAGIFAISLALFTSFLMIHTAVLSATSFITGGVGQTDWTVENSTPATVPIPANYSTYTLKTGGIVAGGTIQLQSDSYTATDDGTLTTTGSATGGTFAAGTSASTNTAVSGTGGTASVKLGFDGGTGADGARVYCASTGTFDGSTCTHIGASQTLTTQAAPFNFTDFKIGSGVTVTVSGANPLRIKAKGNVNIAATGILSLSASGQTGVGGGANGGNGGVGPYSTGTVGSGVGAGAGGIGGSGVYSGGGGAGYGSPGTASPQGAAGGCQYSSSSCGTTDASLTNLLGGSGGGGSSGSALGSGSSGGGGGGAVKITTNSTLTVSGTIRANGANGNGGAFVFGGGGGSGGSIFLQGATVNISGSVTATGGAGGDGNEIYDGGAGAVGRIRVDSVTQNYTQLSALYSFIAPDPGYTACTSGCTASVSYGSSGSFESATIDVGGTAGVSNYGLETLSWNATVPSAAGGTTNPKNTSGLVGLWYMNEASSGSAVGTNNVLDASGNAYHGSGVNGGATAAISYTNGKFGGGALSFDGTDDYVVVGDVLPIEGVSAFTFDAWIRPTDIATTNRGIFSKYASSTSSIDLIQWGSSGDLFVSVRNAANTYGVTTNNPLANNTWYHVAVIFDGSQTGNANRLKLYIDGVLQTLTFTGTIPATTPSSTIPFDIGRLATSTCFQGLIDEVAIYNRALTADEIKAHYGSFRLQVAANNTGTFAATDYVGPDGTANTYFTQPVGLWHLNDATWASANSSGSGLTTTATGAPALDTTNKKLGAGAVTFSSGNYLTVTDNAVLKPAKVSVAAWVRPTSTGAKAIVDKFTSPNGYILGIDASSQAYFTIGNGTSAYTATYTTSALSANTYYHVAGTFDGSNVKVYVNAATPASAAAAVTLTHPASQNLGIGHIAAATVFAGQIDEVMVYDRGLTAAEVTALYNNGMASPAREGAVWDITGLNALDNKQYLRYKAWFGTADTAYTPQLDDITLGYSGYPSSASLTSSKFDAGNSGNILTKLIWDETNTANGPVTVSLRGAASSGGLTGTFSDFTAAGCAKVTNTVTCTFQPPSAFLDANDDQWFQYKVTPGSAAGSATPVVDNVNVVYDTAKFAVSGSTTATAGQPLAITVTAQDSSNVALTSANGYTAYGSVSTPLITITDNDGTAPASTKGTPMIKRTNDCANDANYNFTSGSIQKNADNSGFNTFNASAVTTLYGCFFDAGDAIQIKAAESGGISTSNPMLSVSVAAAAESLFALNAPADITASAGGSRAAYTVTRTDPYGNLVTSGARTVYLYSSSAGANKRFYNVSTGGTAVTSVSIADTASSANFWYSDELAGSFTITASDNATAPDGAGITDAADTLGVNPAVTSAPAGATIAAGAGWNTNYISNANKAAVKVSGTKSTDTDRVKIDIDDEDTFTSPKTITLSSLGAGTSYADATGIDVTSATALADGNIAVRVTPYDVFGNPDSTKAQTVLTGAGTFKKDTVAPATPVINAVATDDVINAAERTATVTVTGTNESGSTVTLNGQAATVVTATTWSYVLSAAAIDAFGQGPETLTAIATDTAGNVNAVNGTRGISADTTAPATPVINAVATDDVINAAERTATVTVTGTNESGSTVTLNGQAATVVTATTWSYVLSAAAIDAFGQGAETLTAVATDTAGNPNAVNGTKAVTVDTVAPTAPTATIATGAGWGADYISNANKTAVKVSGTKSGDTVQVKIDIDDEDTFTGPKTRTLSPLGAETTYADATGIDVMSATALADGNIAIKITAYDAAGNTSVLTVPTTAATFRKTTAATQLNITLTNGQSLAAGGTSGIMTVEAQDQFGYKVTASASTVGLSSSSATMKFYPDSSTAGADTYTGTVLTGTGSITSVILASGTKDFWFRDTSVSAPTHTVTASLASADMLQTSLTGTGDTPPAGGFSAGTKTNIEVTGTGTAAGVKLSKALHINEYTIGALANINVTVTPVTGVTANSNGTWTIAFSNTPSLSRIFKNDKFIDPANKAWKVLSVNDSADKIIVVDSEGNGGSPALSGATQATVGRWYASISTWEAGRNADITATGRNAIERGLPYYDGAPDTTAVTIDGWTTDATHYIEIYVPLSERHRGKWDTGKYSLVVNNADAIYNLANYTRIDGLQVQVTGTFAVIVIKNDANGARISNNIVFNNKSNTSGIGIGPTGDFTGTVYISNNIVYAGTTGGVTGINGYGNSVRYYVYNNTVIGFTTCIYTSPTNPVVAKNNIVQNCTDGFSGTFDGTSDYNISDLASDAPGANSKNSTVVPFVDTTNSDFHLAFRDGTGNPAMNAGADLSADANLAFTTDIDGPSAGSGQATRVAPWDIGADDVGATLVMTHSIGTASRDFSTLQAWEDARDGVLTTRHVYKVNTPTTGTFSTTGETVGSTSGAGCATSPIVGTFVPGKGVNDPYFSVDSVTGGTFSGTIYGCTSGASAAITATLTTAGTIEKGEAYNDSTFTAGVTIDGSATDANHYMWLTVEPRSRHNGVWDTSKVAIVGADGSGSLIVVSDDYGKVDGFQVSTGGWGTDTGISINDTPTIVGITASNNIVKVNPSGGVGIRTGSAVGATIYNNIIQGSSGNNAIIDQESQTSSTYTDYIYNNTLLGQYNAGGISANAVSTTIAKNNIVANCSSNCYTGTFDSSSSNNISSDATAPGTGSLTNVATSSVRFVSTASDFIDLHILDGSAAKDAGADLSATFKSDIDGAALRPNGANFDIGADEWFSSSPVYNLTGTFTSGTIDFGGPVDFSTLTWNAGVPAATGANAFRLQLAAKAADSFAAGDYVGPDGTALTYFTASGTAIPSGLDNKRYLRYKAYLSTADSAFTPQLDDLTMGHVAFDISAQTINPASATKVVFTSTAQTLTAGTASAAYTVQVQDQFGNLRGADALAVDLSSNSAQGKFSTTSGGTYTSTLQIMTSGGAGTFYYKDTLKGTPTLTAASGVLTAGTQGQTVNPDAALTLVFTQQPSSSVTVGTALAVQPVVEIRDQFNNLCTFGSDATLTVALAAVNSTDGSTVLSGTLSNASVGASGGVATFNNISYNQAETLKLKASSGALATALSNAVTVNPGVITPVVTHTDSLVAGATSNMRIQFTATHAVGQNGDVQITFPAGFDLSGALGVVSGNTGATVSALGQVLTINLGTAVSAAGVVDIVISGIKNPGVSGSGGTYTVETQTAVDGKIDEGTAAANNFTPGVLSSPNVQPASLSPNATGNVDVTFTTANPLPIGAKIEVVFPTSLGSGFVLDAAGAGSTAASSGTMNGTFSVAISGATATITRTGGTQAVQAAGETETITLTNIKNPDAAGSTGTYAITTKTGADVTIDTVTGVAADTLTVGTLTATNVQPASLVAGAQGNVTLTFTLATDLPNNGKILVIFPSGFNLTTVGAGDAFSPSLGALTVGVSGQTLTLTRTSGTLKSAGTVINDVTVANVKNPVVSGSTGTYRIDTRASGNGILDQDLSVAADTTTPGVLTNANVESAQPSSSYVGNVTVTFTTANPIPADGKILITFGNGFAFNSGAATAASSASMNGTFAVGINAQTITLTRSGGAQQAAGEAETITLTNVRNPQISGSTGNYQIKTQTGADATIDQDLAVAADTITAGALGSANVQPASLVAGASGNVTVSFTTINPIPLDGKIIVGFPNSFAFNSGGTTGATSGSMDGILAVSISSSTVTMTRSGGTSQASAAETITLSNIRNPQVSGTPGTTYTVQTKDAADTLIDSDTLVAADTFTAGALSSVSVTPASLVAGATGNVTVAFTAANPIPVSGDVQVTFPAGFDISGAAYSSGNAGSSVSVNLQVLTINLGTQVTVPTGSVSIVVSGIKNPVVTGSTGTYALETQDASDTAIDQGTAAANTITVGALTATNVQPASLLAGAVGNVTVSFTTANPIPADGKILITVGSGFTFNSGAATAASSSSMNGTFTVGIVGQTVTLARSVGAQQNAGEAETITLTNIKNPVISGSTGTYTIKTTTNGNVDIDQDAAVTADTITAASLASTNVQPASLKVSTTGNVTVSFTTSNPLPADGKIKITFPNSLGAGFVLSGVGASDASSLDISGTEWATVSGQALTITRSGGLILAAGSLVDDLTIANVKNPDVVGSTGTYSIQTTDSTDVVIDEDTAVTADTTTAGALTAANVQPASLTAGVTGNVTVTFTPEHALPATGKILVTFPAGFNLTGVQATNASSTLINGGLTAGVSGQTVTVSRNGAGSVINAGTAINDLVIANVRNPIVSGSGGMYTIATANSGALVIDQNTSVAADNFVAGVLSATNVQPASLVAGAVGNVTVTFTTQSAIPNDGYIEVTFGSGFNVAGITGASSVADINGGLTTTVSGQTVRITRNGTGGSVGAGATVDDLVIAGVKNPVVTGTTGAYAIATYYSSGIVIDDNTNVAADTVTVGALSATNVQPASLVAGAVGNTTVTFTTANPIPADGKILVTFGSGFDITGVAANGATSGSDINGTLAVSRSGQVLTITRSGGSAVAAGAVIDDLVIANVKNPVVTGSTGTYSIKTTTSADVDIDQNTAVAADTITPGVLTATNVQPASLVAGASGDVTVSFTTANPIPVGGKILVTFPSGFAFNNGGTTAASSASMDGTLAVGVSGQVLTLTRSGGTSQSPAAETITLTNVRNPQVSGSTGVYQIKTTTSADVDIDQDTAVAADTITVGALTSVSVTHASLIAAQTPAATINFTTANPIAAGGKVVVTFDSDFNISGAAFTSGNSGSTVSASSNVLTVTLGTAVSSAEAVSLVIGGIINPAVPQTVDAYALTTKTAADVNIDTGSATGNAITASFAFTSPTGASSWPVGKAQAVTWSVTGTVLTVDLSYAVETDSYVSYTPIVTDCAVAVGQTCASNSYTWTVPNIVPSPQSDRDILTKLKVADSDAGHPAASGVSSAFTVKYHAITWRILDANGNPVTNLCVNEGSTANPPKAAWNAGTAGACTDGTFSGNSTIRYYPDNSGNGKETYTTLFDRLESGTTYSTSSSVWIADMDKIILLTMDTAATATLTYETQINAVYNATNDSIDISSWLVKKGVLVSDIRTDPTAAISVNIYNVAGNQLNASDLGTGNLPNLQGVFSGISYDPAGGLDPSQTYTLKASITYNNKQYTSISGFVSPSVFAYEAKIGAIYNTTNDSIMANVWLERSGTTVTDPGDMTFKVSNSAGTELSSQPFDGYDSTSDAIKDAKLISGVYTNIEYDPAGGLSSTQIYTVKADIVYRGRTYNAVASFAKGELGTIASDLTSGFAGQATQTAAIRSDITGQTSTVTSAITGQTSTLQSTIANQGTTLTNQIGSVGANVTALPTTVSSAVTTAVTTDMNTQLAKGIQAELLTRPADVASGATIPIRFRTASGLSPKITVYDPNGTARVSAAAMKEISTTGIYEYKLTLDTAWGLGDFTVLVNESTRGSTDSLILHVGLGGMDEIYSKLTSASTTTSSSAGVTLDSIFAGVTTIQTSTNGINNDIAALLTRLGKATDSEAASTLFGKIAAIDTSASNEEAILAGVDDIKNYVDTLEGSLGSSADPMSAETIFGRLAEMEDLMKDLGAGSKEVEDAKTKAKNLARLMEEIRADLARGNMAEASAKLAALGQGLTALNNDLSGLPATAGEASVGSAFEDLKEMAAGGGLEALVPLLEEIKKGRETFNPENMAGMRNTVEELKSLMTEVRSLLDQEVNKPVVHGWLEEEQE